MKSPNRKSTVTRNKRTLLSEPPVVRATPTSGRKGTYEHVTTNNPVDQHVGRRVRERRLLMGLSQTAVAQQLGVTGQQYQKYEKGENRISASRLFDLANCLKAPVSHFFDEMTEATRGSSPAHLLSAAPAVEMDLTTAPEHSRRQETELIRLWNQLPDHAQGRVVDLVRSMADLSTEARASMSTGTDPFISFISDS